MRVKASKLGIISADQLVGRRLQYEHEKGRAFIVCGGAGGIYIKHATTDFVYSDSASQIMDNVRRGHLLVLTGAPVPVSLSSLREVLP